MLKQISWKRVIFCSFLFLCWYAGPAWMHRLEDPCYLDDCAKAQNGRDVFVQTFWIMDQETFNFHGIEFYQLQSGRGGPLISVSKTLPLATFLQRNNRSQVIMSIEVTPELERLKR